MRAALPTNAALGAAIEIGHYTSVVQAWNLKQQQKEGKKTEQIVRLQRRKIILFYN